MERVSIMVTEFPSKEWAERFCRELDSSERYRNAARGWKYPILFKVGSRGPGFLVKLEDGRCLGVEWFSDASSGDAPIVISGELDDWMEVIEGRVNPLTAILRRKLKIEKGDISLILRYSVAALEMVAAAQRVSGGSGGVGGRG